MVTVIDWLRALLHDQYLAPQVRRKLFDQILLVRIAPFATEPQAAPAAAGRGWLYSTAGPILALQNVRGASQAERNHIAVGLFTEAAGALGVPVQSALFMFRPRPAAGPTPLSWMLTEEQKRDIDATWESLAASQRPPEDPFGTIDKIFATV
jgi:hypothetical protein